MSYYNRPAPLEEAANRETVELDWMSVLTPRSFAVSAGYVLIGTILSQNQSSVVLRSSGQVAQLLGVLALIRTISSLYDSPDSGKGI
jgi:hypothetical protein